VIAKKTVVTKVVAKKAVAKKVTAKSVAKKVIAKPIAKKAISKPVVKAIAKPVAKKAVAKPIVKAIVKVVAKPVAKPIVKTVAKPISKPVAKPTTKTKVEPVVVVIEPKKINTAPKPLKPVVSKAPVFEEKPDESASITSETKRYSDSELLEFKELINKKLVVAKEELNNLLTQMSNPGINGGTDTDNTYNKTDDGASTSEKEYLSQLAARQRKFIENLENAIIRVENKTYGICKVTGKLISKERLRAVPHTTLSMEAKLQQYK